MTKKFIKVLCFSCICLLAAACGEKENVYFQSETSVAETQRSEAVPETDDTQISEENGIQTEKCFVYICGYSYHLGQLQVRGTFWIFLVYLICRACCSAFWRSDGF